MEQIERITYMEQILDEAMDNILIESEATFERFADAYTVVFH